MNERQKRTPLFDCLKRHAARDPWQFHIPGHKKGAGMDPEFAAFIGRNALAIDLINIAPLDDLHHPHGAIYEAQQLAAEAFGADATFFSVQGTSGAIMTMVMAVCKPGDKIVVPRNVHKSVLAAIIYAGAHPLFLHPEMDENIGIAHGITVSAVEKVLRKHPDVRAVLVINPTYYGIAANLEEIVRLTHRFDIPVLVDEAHGVHTHFHESLPLSAMQAGADMAATSVHKLGGSLTQSSVLNVRTDRIDLGRVQTAISMLTTTSTSYVLLASLDAARRYLATSGHARIADTLQLAEKARRRINELPGLSCVGREILRTEATYDMDESKLIIHVKELGISGFQAETWLREQCNIEVELSDLYNVLCLVTTGDDAQSIAALVQGLTKLSNHYYSPRVESPITVQVPQIPQLALSPREAFYAPKESVPFREAAGRVTAEFVMIYPPGIPVLLPGEVVTADNLAYIEKHLDAGLPVQGPEDETMRHLQVVK